MKKLTFVAIATISVVVSSAILSIISPKEIQASSHREAPFMTTVPKLDITDFYMFQSYDDDNIAEADVNLRRTTLIMNFHPLQDAFGGPNYFFADENARYRINIDNDGDGREDIIFEIDFDFKNDNFRDLALNTGAQDTEIPLIALPLSLDGVEEEADAQQNIVESYTLTIIKNGVRERAINVNNSTANSNFAGTETFVKPLDNIGDTTINDYDAYAQQHVYDFAALNIAGKVFVGQRNDPFIVNLGQAFDGLTINAGSEVDAIAAKNITSFCIEVPNSFLALDDDAATNNVFAGWATTRARGKTNVLLNVGSNNLQNNGLPEGGTIFKQVSRLGMPLVNELVIGLRFKDRFNNSFPRNDSQFAGFVVNSSLAAIMNVVNLNGIIDVAPTENRGDLVAIFAQGVDFNAVGIPVNNVFGPGVAEYQRLDVNTTPVALDAQEPLGLAIAILGADPDGDLSGFPNGRRPLDDTVDIGLKVIAGVFAEALTGGAVIGDADAVNATDGAGDTNANGANLQSEGLDDPLGNGVVEFPFLGSPVPGDDTDA
ncbi:DUF4331 domain-containing protein [Candidatus Uabimicrobium sp. HlEnr_7]|uniref:DUF4331 domain-containing protein n=1 Tax=Candidatus Uabimicrobium helgolandensis TaxID=3095367 RepID=UPI003557E410